MNLGVLAKMSSSSPRHLSDGKGPANVPGVDAAAALDLASSLDGRSSGAPYGLTQGIVSKNSVM